MIRRLDCSMGVGARRSKIAANHFISTIDPNTMLWEDEGTGNRSNHHGRKNTFPEWSANRWWRKVRKPAEGVAAA